jgi:N-acetylglucosaminyldiphosphoundecaprenol N-acetyl-beta-D-mannosaminyltransferase
VIGAPIDVISMEAAVARITEWGLSRDSRVICICNAHSAVTARQDADFMGVLERADMATPDGTPLAYVMRHLGEPAQKRVNGPDLMWLHCRDAAEKGLPIYLYGSTPETLGKLSERLVTSFPELKIAGSYSPPFRALSADEEAAIVDDINASGARVVWVGLGCPKQERWMDRHKGRINAVMVGVGAAFDYHAGVISRAPLWMQHNGLEWLHRLCSEPRRLWKRYLVTNSLFIWYAMRQLVVHPRH